MTTGWLEENDSWYYLDKDGQKITGWLTLNGKNITLIKKEKWLQEL